MAAATIGSNRSPRRPPHASQLLLLADTVMLADTADCRPVKRGTKGRSRSFAYASLSIAPERTEAMFVLGARSAKSRRNRHLVRLERNAGRQP